MKKIKVYRKIIGLPYNEYGCGFRIQFLFISNRHRFFSHSYSFLLNKKLNKLVEYWNYHGKDNPIYRNEMYVTFNHFPDDNTLLQCSKCQKYKPEKEMGFFKFEATNFNVGLKCRKCQIQEKCYHFWKILRINDYDHRRINLTGKCLKCDEIQYFQLRKAHCKYECFSCKYWSSCFHKRKTRMRKEIQNGIR